jgi:hypothetical protein
MQDDISLKNKILAEAVPSLSSSFRSQTSRLLIERFGSDIPVGMGRVIIWHRSSRVQIFGMIMIAVVATFLWQAHVQKENEDDLNKIDTMSMSSLLTL